MIRHLIGRLRGLIVSDYPFPSGTRVARTGQVDRQGMVVCQIIGGEYVDVSWDGEEGLERRVPVAELCQVVETPEPGPELPMGLLALMRAEQDADPEPEEDTPYRLDLEDVQPGAVLLVPVPCRRMMCPQAYHERRVQVLDTRSLGDAYSLKCLDDDGKQQPYGGAGLTLVKVVVD